MAGRMRQPMFVNESDGAYQLIGFRSRSAQQ